MKKVLKTLILTMLLGFAGCNKTTEVVELEIVKNGELSLASISEIFERYDTLNPESHILYSVNFPYETETEKNTSYRIEFPVKFINSKAVEVNFDLCEKGMKQKDQSYQPYQFMYENEASSLHIYDSIAEKQTYNDEVSVFYSIEDFQQRGLIGMQSDNQEDICLYVNLSVDIGYTKRREVQSNILRYTAEEINAAVAEYEQLKAEE